MRVPARWHPAGVGSLTDRPWWGLAASYSRYCEGIPGLGRPGGGGVEYEPIVRAAAPGEVVTTSQLQPGPGGDGGVKRLDHTAPESQAMCTQVVPSYLSQRTCRSWRVRLPPCQ